LPSAEQKVELTRAAFAAEVEAAGPAKVPLSAEEKGRIVAEKREKKELVVASRQHVHVACL
jgi:hypothetical protein